MVTVRTLWSMLLVVVLSGCSLMQISSDYDTSADFAGLKTYSWITELPTAGDDPSIDMPFIDERVRNAVNSQLDAQGYEKRSSSDADFLVSYHVAIDKKLAVSTMDEYYGTVIGPRWYHDTPRWYGSEPYVYDYEEGSLVLDVIDAKTRKLVWRGTARAEIDRTAKAERRTKRINEAVKRILAQFPPKLQ